MSSYKQYTDNELIRLLKADDHNAFAEIYSRFAETLFQQAYRVLKNREETKDIVQELFASLWNKRADCAISNLAGYLYMANRNQVIKIVARKKITSNYFDWLQATTEEGIFNSDYTIREKQLQELIEKEIEKLPSKMRLVFNMSRKAHLTHKEIAAKLQLSESTVKTQVKNVLRTLRGKLEVFLYFFILYLLFYVKP